MSPERFWELVFEFFEVNQKWVVLFGSFLSFIFHINSYATTSFKTNESMFVVLFLEFEQDLDGKRHFRFFLVYMESLNSLSFQMVRFSSLARDLFLRTNALLAIVLVSF